LAVAASLLELWKTYEDNSAIASTVPYVPALHQALETDLDLIAPLPPHGSMIQKQVRGIFQPLLLEHQRISSLNDENFPARILPYFAREQVLDQAHSIITQVEEELPLPVLKHGSYFEVEGSNVLTHHVSFASTS